MALDPDEQRLLNKTLNIRERIMDVLMQGGLPSSNEDRELLIKAIDGSDRTILGKARLKLDESANQNQAAMQEVVANVMMRLSTTPKSTTAIPPAIDKSIERPQPVDGETHVGVIDGSYDEFMKRMG